MSPSDHAPSVRGTGEEILAEIVGSVRDVFVTVNDIVGQGDPILLMESMKMEIPVLAERGGRVTDLLVRPGTVVREGDLLALLDSSADRCPQLDAAVSFRTHGAP